MMKVFLKHQLSYALKLVAGFVLPLWLYLQFSPYRAPKVSYVMLAILGLSQYVFYKEKAFRARIAPQVADVLKREAGRVPSQKEIILRSGQVIQARGASIVACAVLILVLMFAYNDF